MTNCVHELQFVHGKTPAFHNGVTDHKEIKFISFHYKIQYGYIQNASQDYILIE
jgi:hypothetical protein